MLTKEELEQINRFSKAELREDQVYTFSVRLCDNEVDRDGEQFPQATLEQLAERFVRGDESRSTEGSGLGLSISKMLTELMGGKFEIDLEDDLFRVKLTFRCKE